jgi:predicted negative regulator of RcsB-dependent stress response
MESQDTAATFFFKVWPQIEANKNKIFGATIVVVVVIFGYSFYSWQHNQNQIEAGDALTQALISTPQTADATTIASTYLDVSTQYPGTPAGERALIQGAAALFVAGKYADAQTDFQQYVNSYPDGEFAGQASLGVAKCQDALGKADQAAGSYQHIIDNSADPQAVIEAKFSLARLDVDNHNYPEAMRLFQDVMQADPYGPLGSEAGQYAFEIKSKVPATSVVPPGTAPAKSPLPFNLNH